MYIIIVGCGRVGSELAKLLSGEGHDVVVVDREQKSFDYKHLILARRSFGSVVIVSQ